MNPSPLVQPEAIWSSYDKALANSSLLSSIKTYFEKVNSSGTGATWRYQDMLACMVVTLNSKIEDLNKQLAKLETIAPRRIKLPDGKIYVWHCPDDLIPLKEGLYEQRKS